MAGVMVLVSGWIGLTFAILGQFITDATFWQFFATWMQAGIGTLLVFGAAIVLRRVSQISTSQHA
jgi:hypothetical protein